MDPDQEQQFHHLQQQVQDMLVRESSGQLTQVQSVMQATLNEAIEKAASATAQASVSAFSETPPSTPITSTRVGLGDNNVSPAELEVQFRPTAGNGALVPPLINLDEKTLTDSVHELPAKLVKEILSGEFMELSKLLPKNFNYLQPLHDEPLTLTLDNSVIRVTKAKATSITDIGEWTSAFTAYMSVIINKYPPRAAELLEYMSLIRYAAKYHKGLGWCVYDIKFRHKAAANKSLKWSAIDSQLWLKTFTVAPSLMKEELGVFQSGPSSTASTFRGNDNRTCHNFNKCIPKAKNPCIYAHKCNRPGCGKDHPGIRCPSTPESEKEPLSRVGKSQHHSTHHRGK